MYKMYTGSSLYLLFQKLIPFSVEKVELKQCNPVIKGHGEG